MEMKSPLVSVVVPVYKVEKYIHECVDSILQQTYEDIELILVDDGSPDNCGVLCDEYAKADPRVKVIHKENGGLSDARNAGIDIAQGEYITFVDSDDFISKNYLSSMIRMAQSNEADIVQIEATHDCDGLGKNKKDNRQSIMVFSPSEALINMLRFQVVQVMAWGKLYKRKLFENIRYPKGRLNEDNLTTYKLLLAAKKNVVCSPEQLYFYRVNNEGIMNSSFNVRRYEILTFRDEINDYLGINAKQYTSEIDYSEMRMAIRLYNECVVKGKDLDYKKEQDQVYELLKTFHPEHIKCELKYKILLNIISHSRNLYDAILRLKSR